jgi:hypothetical protein
MEAKHWESWLEFCGDARRDPYLLNCSKPIQQQLLLGFAARVWRGYYGRGAQVQAQTPETALRHVAQTLVLNGYPDPRRSYGSKDLDLSFSRLLRSYKTNDPAPKPQLALPVRAIQCAVDHYTHQGTPKACAIADLLTIAFFFLLRPGEYTMPSGWRKTLTVQFRQQDIRFFKNGAIFPHNTPLPALKDADGARLYIDNQKMANVAAPCIIPRAPAPSVPSKRLPLAPITSTALHPTMTPFPSASLPPAPTSRPHRSPWPSAKVSSYPASSILATVSPVSVLTRSVQVEQWPFASMMLARISSKNLVDGPARPGLLTFMLKSLLLPQAFLNASTMSSTMWVPNLSVPLPRLLRLPGGVSRSHPERPNTLMRCRSWRTCNPRCTGTNLHDNRPALLVRALAPALQGGNPLRPIQREQRTLVREETKASSESGPGSSDGPQGGRILCENEKGASGL